MMQYQKELDFAKDLAIEAGKIMRRYFRAEDIGTEWKDDNTPLTIADTSINKLVIEKVKAAFPDQGVLGEEESYKPERETIWVVDPIDGTKPFSLGIPVSTFLLALVSRADGQPVLGVIYDPYLEHLYTAVKGQGAFLNGRRLKTSSARSFTNGYATVYGFKPLKNNSIDYSAGKVIDGLLAKKASVINISSGAYTAAKIASGEFLTVIEMLGKPWDSAAVALLVQEAGGLVTDFVGQPRRFDEVGFGSVMAANPAILKQVLALIKGGYENSGN